MRREESEAKDGGSFVGGGDNGRKPLGRETVNGAISANSLSSVGMVVRIGKVGDAARDPIPARRFVVGMFGHGNVFCGGYVKERWCKGETSGYMYCWPEVFRPQ